MEILVSFQLPTNSLAYTRSSFANSWNDTGISISLYSCVTIDTYNVINSFLAGLGRNQVKSG